MFCREGLEYWSIQAIDLITYIYIYIYIYDEVNCSYTQILVHLLDKQWIH